MLFSAIIGIDHEYRQRLILFPSNDLQAIFVSLT
jgi:hypothetical protein